MYLLDTNVLSEGLRPTPDANVESWTSSTGEEDLYISVVTLAEIHRGVRILAAGKRREALDKWLRVDLMNRFDRRILGLTVEIADVWGETMARAKANGRGLQVMDGFILATALTHSMTLVTRNTKDFARLGVEMINPWQA